MSLNLIFTKVEIRGLPFPAFELWENTFVANLNFKPDSLEKSFEQSVISALCSKRGQKFIRKGRLAKCRQRFEVFPNSFVVGILFHRNGNDQIILELLDK